MGIFRMYTGADGTSVIEELRQDDPILETLKTCTGCALQVNEPSEFSDFHPAPRRRWMTMISGQIDIQLADGTIYSFGPEDLRLRLWEDVTGQGHRTRFRCVRSASPCTSPTKAWSLVVRASDGMDQCPDHAAHPTRCPIDS